MIVNTFFEKIKDISQDELEKDIKYFVSLYVHIIVLQSINFLNPNSIRNSLIKLNYIRPNVIQPSFDRKFSL